jgi:hypothetical protein
MNIGSLAKAIGLELNEQQEEAVTAVSWLYNVGSGRRTGRTTLLLLGAFNAALNHPGEAVRVIDHFADPRSLHLRENLIRDWEGIITSKLKLKGHFAIQTGHGHLTIAFMPTPPEHVEVEPLDSSTEIS